MHQNIFLQLAMQKDHYGFVQAPYLGLLLKSKQDPNRRLFDYQRKKKFHCNPLLSFDYRPWLQALNLTNSYVDALINTSKVIFLI